MKLIKHISEKDSVEFTIDTYHPVFEEAYEKMIEDIEQGGVRASSTQEEELSPSFYEKQQTQQQQVSPLR